MKKFFKAIGTILMLSVIAGAAVVTTHLSKEENSKTLIASYTNGSYLLEIYSVGDVESSGGKADCRFIFKNGDETLCSYDFTVANNGKALQESNFRVSWGDDKVVVTAMGENQKNHDFSIYYDGTVFTVVS
ncbi:MAG: hypothetical protein IJL87_00425 [Clostridia bacterium]|nr:hypothetical protein [Clostridia bacterium]